MQVCPQCQSDRLVNNGSAAGKPKRLCRQCGYQFTRTTPRGKPLAMKVHAVLLYLSGISMNRIAFLLRVSAQSVLNWIRAFATEHYKALDEQRDRECTEEVLSQLSFRLFETVNSSVTLCFYRCCIGLTPRGLIGTAQCSLHTIRLTIGHLRSK
jgi:transposase-like protein